MTDNIIATSGPSSVWPKKAYRNPVDQLVKFLDKKHNEDWAIFEFRAEGTGYPDEEVYGRVHHFPWPDHHPPPFGLMPQLMAAMRNWVYRERPEDQVGHQGQIGTHGKGKKRIAVVHCKAGKGRSGTVACSYLISQEGWNKEEALQRFTERRMRVGFGAGVSIPSQLRWVNYIDRWTHSMNKKYIERPVEIMEVHVWGLRDGVKVVIEGYVDEGRRIESFHLFHKNEKIVTGSGKKTQVSNSSSSSSSHLDNGMSSNLVSPIEPKNSNDPALVTSDTSTTGGETVILKPSKSVVLPTSDINIDFERRNKATYTGFTMVTSIAHVWFNAYFEGGHLGHDSGVFEIEWEAMDGIKGSARKGTKALDRLKVVWRYAEPGAPGIEVKEPKEGEKVEERPPADWTGKDTDKGAEEGAKHSDGVTSGRAGGAMLTMVEATKTGADSLGKELGLRKDDPMSANISRAGSEKGSSPPTEHSNALAQGKRETRSGRGSGTESSWS